MDIGTEFGLDMSIHGNLLEIEQELMLSEPGWLEEEMLKNQHCEYPCHIFEVLGTAEMWQGKYVVQRAGVDRPFVHIKLWPVQLIVNQCELEVLYLLGATCKEFLKMARKRLEQRAHKTIRTNFLNEQFLIKFVDLFGYFDFATQLKSWLNFNSLQNWTTEELQQMYNEQLQKIQTDTNYYYGEQLVHFNNLAPCVRHMWITLGFKAFKLFFYNCIAMPGSNDKILWHYNRAWKKICALSRINACILLHENSPDTIRMLGGKNEFFKKVKCQVDATWPNIFVLIDAPAAELGWPAHKVPQCLCTFGFGSGSASLKWKESMGSNLEVLWVLEKGKPLRKTCISNYSSPASLVPATNYLSPPLPQIVAKDVPLKQVELKASMWN